MTKGPEDVLPQNRRAAMSGQEKMPIEPAIDQDHGQPSVQHGQRDQDKERVNEIHPGKERQPTHGHSWGTTGNHGGDGVDPETNRAKTANEKHERPATASGRRGV